MTLLAGMLLCVTSAFAQSEAQPTFAMAPGELLPAMHKVAEKAGQRLIGIRPLNCRVDEELYACGISVGSNQRMMAYSLSDSAGIIQIELTTGRPYFHEVEQVLFPASMVIRTIDHTLSEKQVMDIVASLSQADYSADRTAEVDGNLGTYRVYPGRYGAPVFEAVPRSH